LVLVARSESVVVNSINKSESMLVDSDKYRLSA